METKTPEVVSRELTEQLRKLGLEDPTHHIDSLRAGVLTLVVGESYEAAVREMRAYVDARKDFPIYQERAARYVGHCADLVEAIRAKRQVPGIASMSMSKQQELHEKVLEHFQELKQNLKHVEKLERDAKLADVRSTVWVVYALSIAVLMIFAAGFAIDVRSGLLSSTLSEGGAILNDWGDRVVAHLPFL